MTLTLGMVFCPTDQPSRWRWEELALEAGFSDTELLARRPSRFLREIYSAASRGL